MLHIGSKAPDFAANSTMGPLKISDYKGKWVILFSHPGDFTPVCTTEFIAFAEANEDFVQRNTQLIGLSIDSNPSHLAWVHTISEITGITIPFPVIADRMGDVARLYGMIAPDVSNHETVRNVYFIDKEQTIRAILVYPMTNGRNIQEIIRLLTALQTSDESKVVTPANWQSGQPAMVPPPQTYNQLINRSQNPQDSGLECKDWFWCYKAKPQISASSPAIAARNNAGNPPEIQNAAFHPDEIISEIEGLTNQIGAARPTGTGQQLRSQFLLFQQKIDQLEDKIELLKKQVKADYNAGRITWEEIKNIDRIIDTLEDRLVRMENLLKRNFGMNNR